MIKRNILYVPKQKMSEELIVSVVVIGVLALLAYMVYRFYKWLSGYDPRMLATGADPCCVKAKKEPCVGMRGPCWRRYMDCCMNSLGGNEAICQGQWEGSGGCGQ